MKLLISTGKNASNAAIATLVPSPKPNQMTTERRDGDLGQALQREGVGHQQLFDHAAFCHQRAENEPQPDADAKPIAALLSVPQSGR